MADEALSEDERKFAYDNIGLVGSVAKRFMRRNSHYGYEDLFQQGCIGLVKAAKNFDKSRGFKFSTYAVPMIVGEIRRELRDNGTTTKMPRSILNNRYVVCEAVKELTGTLGREPYIEEIAEKTSLTEAVISDVLNAMMPAISFSQRSNGKNSGKDDNDLSFGDTISSDECVEDEVLDKFCVDDLISIMPDKYKDIIKMRISGMSQIEIAEAKHTSQAHISRALKICKRCYYKYNEGGKAMGEVQKYYQNTDKASRKFNKEQVLELAKEFGTDRKGREKIADVLKKSLSCVSTYMYKNNMVVKTRLRKENKDNENKNNENNEVKKNDVVESYNRNNPLRSIKTDTAADIHNLFKVREISLNGRDFNYTICDNKIIIKEIAKMDTPDSLRIIIDVPKIDNVIKELTSVAEYIKKVNKIS